MQTAETIGFIAAALTATSFVPQLIRILRTKSAKDISTFTLWQLIVGCSLWLYYGILVDSISIMINNVVSLLILLIVLICCVRYR